MTKLYWVSLIIQDYEDSKPWLCSFALPHDNIEESKKSIERGRKNYRVLSAWIDTFDKDKNKTTVFHECYLNALGQLDTI